MSPKMFQKELDNWDEVWAATERTEKVIYCMEHGHTISYASTNTTYPPIPSTYVCTHCESQVVIT